MATPVSAVRTSAVRVPGSRESSVATSVGSSTRTFAADSTQLVQDLFNELSAEDEDGKIWYQCSDLDNSEMFQGICSLWKNQQLLDVTIKSISDKSRDNEGAKGHSVVLASASQYLHDLLREAGRPWWSSHLVLELDLPQTVIATLVAAIYERKLPLDQESVAAILMGAQLLELSFVRDACNDFLTRHLSVGNWFNTLQIAQVCGCPSLVQESLSYARANFSDVVTNNGSVALGDLPFEALQSLIQGDDLEAPQELDVFKAVLAWIRYDLDARREQLPDLIQHVRLPLLSVHELLTYVKGDDLVRTSKEALQLVNDAYAYLTMPQKRERMHTPLNANPRLCYATIIVALGGRGEQGKALSDVEVYLPEKDTWIEKPSLAMHVPRIHAAAVALPGGKVYVVGGDSRAEGKVESCDMRMAEEWVQEQSLHVPRSGHRACALGGRLYVVGGIDEHGSVLRSVERFNPATGEWTSVLPMGMARSGAGVASLHGMLYVAGGHDSRKEDLCAVERYDPRKKTWTRLADLPEPRSQMGLTSLDGLLYAVGGWKDRTVTDTVFVYNPARNSWRSVEEVPFRLRGAAVCVLRGQLFLAGTHIHGIASLPTSERSLREARCRWLRSWQ